MNFQLMGDDVVDHYYHVHVSDGGLVRVGIHPVLFGYRVVGWFTGSVGPSLNWCAGTEQADVERLYSLMLAALAGHEEDHQCFEGMPSCSRIKPFYLDVDFLTQVVQLAGENLQLIKLPPMSEIRMRFLRDLAREHPEVVP